MALLLSRIMLVLQQVLCWGVRDMKHYLLLPVDSPLVKVECGGVVQRSQHIEDTRKNPNFPDPLIHFEVVSLIHDIVVLDIGMTS